MYAYRAIAYTLTAWAFNKPLPQSSNKLLLNIREGGVVAQVVLYYLKLLLNYQQKAYLTTP